MPAYQSPAVGSLLDRIDLTLEVPALKETDLQSAPQGEPSVAVRERMAAAWTLQRERQGGSNARLGGADLDRYCQPDDAGRTLLAKAVERLHLSARAYRRILRVARAIVDLVGSPAMAAAHLAEAVPYWRGFEG